MKKLILNKPNELISINSKEPISLTQRKAYNIFLKNAQNLIKFENYDKNYFRIPVTLLHKNSNINNKNLDYVYKEEIKKLMSTVVEITDKENPKNWEAFTLLSHIRRDGEYYYYELNNFIITALKEQKFFTTLDLLIINSLKSQYSIIFYELAIRYKKYKIPKMSLENIRALTNTQNEYSRIEAFRRRVLDVACEEISEKTDIILSYTTEKIGRRISYIDFKITTKSNRELEYIETKEELENIFEEPTTGSVEDNFLSELEEREIKKVIYKIPFEVAKCLFEKYREKESFEFFIYCLEKTEKEAIKNPLTYFEKIIEIDSVKSEFKIKKHNKELKKKEQLEKEEKIKKKEEEKIKNERSINFSIELIMSEKGETYNKHKKDVLCALIKGFVEDKKYIFKSEEEIPEEIIDKYIRISLKQDLMG